MFRTVLFVIICMINSLLFATYAQVNETTSTSIPLKQRIIKHMLDQETRTYDGTNNNTNNYGQAGQYYLRLVENDYTDGTGSPSGSDRPGARDISNNIFDQDQSQENPQRKSSFLRQWGQFLDHDINLTHSLQPDQAFPIPVPIGDQRFDPFNIGTTIIPFFRSEYTQINGIREQINSISSFIDGSVIYGSSYEQSQNLRTLDGSGTLKTSTANNTEVILPVDAQGHFYAGDERANEQIGLTAMHSLFVREHNYRAKRISDIYPDFQGDEIYLLARDIVTAELQAITYNEYLPEIFGETVISRYTGYKPNIDAGISNEFASAAFRFGHTQLPEQLRRIDSSGQEAPEGHLPLKDAFFQPIHIQKYGIENVLRGLHHQHAQEIDAKLVHAIRNMLFGPPGAGGMDLASLNIQRGRDHGIHSLNHTRKQLGLGVYDSFISMSHQQHQDLASIYTSPNQVDLWVGGLAEKRYKRALVGETFYTILVDQFTRLRDGDRFWYENRHHPVFVRFIDTQRLHTIIVRNTDIQAHEMRRNVFRVYDN